MADPAAPNVLDPSVPITSEMETELFSALRTHAIETDSRMASLTTTMHAILTELRNSGDSGPRQPPIPPSKPPPSPLLQPRPKYSDAIP